VFITPDGGGETLELGVPRTPITVTFTLYALDVPGNIQRYVT
jgi:hypothetical protein